VRGVTETADGRSARSARTREAVVTAALDLVRSGNPRPTAKEIAARAGISLRSVYVHFDDLDDLFAAVGARQAEEVAHLLYAVDASLPLPDRIEAVARQRAALWEVLAPVREAAIFWAHRSPRLREGNQRMSRRATRDLDRVFGPELDAWGDARAVALEALAVAASQGAWDVLRRERGLGVDRASGVVIATMTAVLRGPETRPTVATGAHAGEA
jgi:AcrR family transcriptional regulator